MFKAASTLTERAGGIAIVTVTAVTAMAAYRFPHRSNNGGKQEKEYKQCR